MAIERPEATDGSPAGPKREWRMAKRDFLAVARNDGAADRGRKLTCAVEPQGVEAKPPSGQISLLKRPFGAVDKDARCSRRTWQSKSTSESGCLRIAPVIGTHIRIDQSVFEIKQSGFARKPTPRFVVGQAFVSRPEGSRHDFPAPRWKLDTMPSPLIRQAKKPCERRLTHMGSWDSKLARLGDVLGEDCGNGES
jgi:hypothetical protein